MSFGILHKNTSFTLLARLHLLLLHSQLPLQWLWARMLISVAGGGWEERIHGRKDWRRGRDDRLCMERGWKLAGRQRRCWEAGTTSKEDYRGQRREKEWGNMSTVGRARRGSWSSPVGKHCPLSHISGPVCVSLRRPPVVDLGQISKEGVMDERRE